LYQGRGFAFGPLLQERRSMKRLLLLVVFMLVMLAQSVPASALPWFRPWDIPREWLEYCYPYTVWKDYYTGEIYCTEYLAPIGEE